MAVGCAYGSSLLRPRCLPNVPLYGYDRTARLGFRSVAGVICRFAGLTGLYRGFWCPRSARFYWRSGGNWSPRPNGNARSNRCTGFYRFSGGYWGTRRNWGPRSDRLAGTKWCAGLSREPRCPRLGWGEWGARYTRGHGFYRPQRSPRLPRNAREPRNNWLPRPTGHARRGRFCRL